LGLTAAQRAIVAARALERMPERRGRPKKGEENLPDSGTLSRDMVAKKFKVNKESVQQAKALLVEAPDLAEQVEGCTLSVEVAWQRG
jgi:hypothetical protein